MKKILRVSVQRNYCCGTLRQPHGTVFKAEHTSCVAAISKKKFWNFRVLILLRQVFWGYISEGQSSWAGLLFLLSQIDQTWVSHRLETPFKTPSKKPVSQRCETGFFRRPVSPHGCNHSVLGLVLFVLWLKKGAAQNFPQKFFTVQLPLFQAFIKSIGKYLAKVGTMACIVPVIAIRLWHQFRDEGQG